MLASPTQERKESLLLRERKQTTLHCLVVLGIGGNGADFRDIFGDHLWNRVDGWMETHDAVPKHQTSC